MKEEITRLEKYQHYCKQLLSIFSNHNTDNPKQLDAIEGAIVYLIERFRSVVHSLPVLIDVYYKNSGVNGHSIYSVLRSFSLDAMQVCEYSEIIANAKGKDEETVKGELDEFASRHFCDEIWNRVNGLDQDSENFQLMLNNYPYCFIAENGKWKNAYKNRIQPKQVKISVQGLDNFYSNMLELYGLLSKIEHFNIIGHGIIRTPEIFRETVPSIIQIDMKNYLSMLTILYEGAFEKYEVSKPILEELNKE